MVGTQVVVADARQDALSILGLRIADGLGLKCSEYRGGTASGGQTTSVRSQLRAGPFEPITCREANRPAAQLLRCWSHVADRTQTPASFGPGSKTRQSDAQGTGLPCTTKVGPGRRTRDPSPSWPESFEPQQ